MTGLSVYNFITQSYFLAIRCASVFNKKAKAAIQGREGLFSNIQRDVLPEDRIIWFHCSSAGELEQAKPLIEALKERFHGYKILITFFSPSGLHAAKNYTAADYKYYLPFDSKEHAAHFVSLVKPVLAVFVKYEFWYHYLKTLSNEKIPTLLLSASFRQDQFFFKAYGRFYRSVLPVFDRIFVQNETSLQLLKQVNVSNAQLSGDTRFDQVIKTAATDFEDAIIETFIGNEQVLIAGSTWKKDEALLKQFHLANPQIKIIIAPHEINTSHIREITELFQGAYVYSVMDEKRKKSFNPKSTIWNYLEEDEWKLIEAQLKSAQVLLIDITGMLSRLYRLASICWIGGGFTKDGIHNILEAAVYRKPVVFGPNYKKYREAIKMIAAGGAFSVRNADELSQLTGELLSNPEKYNRAAEAAAQYVHRNTGATETVIRYIQEKRLLTR